MKTVSVMEGESFTLHTDVSEVQKYFLIQWMFGSTRIAEVNRLTQTSSTYGGPDERFRDRLHVDQTGSVTIINTRSTDSGVYKVTVISSETSYMTFNVTVYETPLSSSSPESSSSYNFVSSRCVVNNSTINQTKNLNITELHQPCSGTPFLIYVLLSVIRFSKSDLCQEGKHTHVHLWPNTYIGVVSCNC
uniref:Zmp:0000000652 n=1 Tax=Cyprinus carpio TaxID=7962 RepID=A0A8C2JDQ2_CYPCA